MDTVSKFAEKFEFALSDQVTPDCILFMPDQDRTVKRSFKYMLAVLLGCPVLSVEYINACYKSNMLIVDIKDFLMHGDECDSDEIIEKTMRSHALDEPGLFHSLNFYLYGQYDRPCEQEIAQLIKKGNGDVLNSINKLKKGTIVLCDPSVTGTFEKDAGIIYKHRPIISIAWIMDSISCYTLLDRHLYIVL
jgi:hypothetical protein